MQAEHSELKKTIASMEVELKANRGTIARLASEAEQQHKNALEYLSQIQIFVKEKDDHESARKSLNNKIEELKNELYEKENENKHLTKQMTMLAENINETKRQAMEVESSKTFLGHFRNDVIKLLFDGKKDDIPDEIIFEKISILKDDSRRCFSVKKDNEKLSENLKRMPNQADVSDLKRRIQSLEMDLTEINSTKEKLKKDEGKMKKFVNQLWNNLGIDKVGFDPGLDDMMDAILTRANQLLRNEGSSLTDRQTQIYSLQRKIKSLNETLESRNMHLDLLKKKVSSMEQQKMNKSDFEKEKDDAILKARKLMKLVDKYKKENEQANSEIKDLKARLLSALAIANDKQVRDDELEELRMQNSDLESVCRELSHKMEALKKEKLDEKKSKDRLKNEHDDKMKNLLTDIDQKSSAIRQHEELLRHINSFKQKLTDMLMTDLTPQTGNSDKLYSKSGSSFHLSEREILSEDEIITRVNYLIELNKQNAATAYVLDSAISDMAEGLRAGFRKAALNVSKDVSKPATIDNFDRSLKNLVSRSQLEFS